MSHGANAADYTAEKSNGMPSTSFIMNAGNSSSSNSNSPLGQTENVKCTGSINVKCNDSGGTESSSSPPVNERSPVLACDGVASISAANCDDNSPFKSHSANSDVCRDYLRNLCKRGDRCKFKHPPKTQDVTRSKAENLFCHDYANNRQCARSDSCKFLHASRDEEVYYKTTGDLPPRLAEQARRKGLEPEILGLTPICKDFLKGTCARGDKCRFQHQIPLPPDLDASRSPTPERLVVLHHQQQQQLLIRGGADELLQCALQQACKRRKWDNIPIDAAGGLQRFTLTAAAVPSLAISPLHFSSSDDPNKCIGAGQQQQSCCTAGLELRASRDENIYLRRRVDELEKKVYTLTAQNDYLTSVHSSAATQAGLNAAVVAASPVASLGVPVNSAADHSLLSAAAHLLVANAAVASTAGQPASLLLPSGIPTPVTVSIASTETVNYLHHPFLQHHTSSTSPTLYTTYSTSPTPSYPRGGVVVAPLPGGVNNRLMSAASYHHHHPGVVASAAASNSAVAAQAAASVVAQLTAADPYAAAAVAAAVAASAAAAHTGSSITLSSVAPHHLSGVSCAGEGGYIPLSSIVTPMTSMHYQHLAAGFGRDNRHAQLAVSAASAGAAAVMGSTVLTPVSAALSSSVHPIAGGEHLMQPASSALAGGGVLYHHPIVATQQTVAVPSPAAAAAAVARALHHHHSQQQQQHAAATAAAVAAVQQVVAAATGTAPPTMS